MNILMVHPHDIYSPSEPWTVRIVSLAREFVKEGHKVRLVYFPLQQDGQGPAEVACGITAFPFSRRHGPGVLIANIAALLKLAHWADVVHIQKCFYHAALPAIIAAYLCGKPLHYDWDDWEVKIYEVSTQPGMLRNSMKWFLNTLEVIIPRVADSVSVSSERLKAESRRLGVDADRLAAAPVGADTLRFHPGISGERVRERHGINNPLVLYLGQLHGGQYVEIFIEAAARIIHEYRRDASFMIVGDGYLAQELKKRAREANLDGKLIFAGSVSHDEVPEYLAAADVCVACFKENDVTLCKSPLKIAEYMASGKAVVASDVGEVPRMLGEAGVITAPGDTAALARGILRLLDDENLRKGMGMSARKRAEGQYNWGVSARNILGAYRKIAKQ